MNKQSLLIVGPLVTFLGVFCPIISVPFFGSLTYMARKDSDGMILLGVATILIFCGLFKWKGASAILALVNIVLMGISFFRMLSVISDMPNSVAVSLQWGWGLLFGGMILTLIGAFTPDEATHE